MVRVRGLVCARFTKSQHGLKNQVKYVKALAHSEWYHKYKELKEI